MSVRQGDTLIANGDVPVDGSTVTSNANGSIQANGVKNKNTSVGAIGEIYDWVGTLQEYNDQSVATLHPDWICFITDDNQSVIVNYANRDASNFTDTGTTVLSKLGKPDMNRYEELTVLVTGSEYTAPANGYFFGTGTCRSGASVGIVRLENKTNPDILVDTSSWCSGAVGRKVSVFLPVKKDDIVSFVYGAYTNDALSLTFIYADGDKTNS